MNALAVVPDIGLDLRKLPDLADAATRSRLSPPAISAFFAIVEKWGLRNEDAMALLGGASHGRYYELKKNRKGLLSQDELTRISLLIGIFKALNILFSQRPRTHFPGIRTFRSPRMKTPPRSCDPTLHSPRIPRQALPLASCGRACRGIR